MIAGFDLAGLFAGLAISSVLAFALASILIELTPGPNMTWLAMVGSVEGRSRGFAAVAGVALGLAVIGVAAALGVTSWIDRTPFAWQALRWAGVAYLLWLAWDGWRQSAAYHAEIRSVGHAVYFRRGLITNLLNPKAAVFYVAVLPGFLPPAPPLAHTLALTAVYVLVATGIHAGIVALAGFAEPFLNNPYREAAARKTLSLALVGVAIWFALNTAR